MTDVWKPHATVAAIVEREQRFLMVEEIRDGRQVYNQPSGHLEPKESIIDAVIRETQEEAAWDFNPEYLGGIYRWDQADKNRCFVRFNFIGSVSNHQPELILDDGIIRALWLSRDELASQPEKLRSPLVMRCIDDYLAGKRYPLDILIDIE